MRTFHPDPALDEVPLGTDGIEMGAVIAAPSGADPWTRPQRVRRHFAWAAFILDLVSVARLIIVPAILVSMLGGPVYLLVTPFAVYGIVLYGSQFALLFRGRRDLNLFKAWCSGSCPQMEGDYGALGVGVAAPPASEDLVSLADGLWRASRYQRSTWCCLASVDVLVSCVLFAIVLVVQMFVFTQPDGRTDLAWSTNNHWATATTVFLFLAVLGYGKGGGGVSFSDFRGHGTAVGRD